MHYIAFDAHKHYTPASVAEPDGRVVREQRIPHEGGALQHFLAQCEWGSPVALETTGNWYWIVDEIEAAGCRPKLVHARKAKLMMGMTNKTDKLDARGLEPSAASRHAADGVDSARGPATNETFHGPEWSSSGNARLKNRIHATLAKYAMACTEVSDLFGAQGRELLCRHLERSPTSHSVCRPRSSSNRLTASIVRCVSSSSESGWSSSPHRESPCS